jgi:hypothetical protein
VKWRILELGQVQGDIGPGNCQQWVLSLSPWHTDDLSTKRNISVVDSIDICGFLHDVASPRSVAMYQRVAGHDDLC